MCGRYMLSSNGEAIAAEFDLEASPDIEPRYNIAPSQQVLIVRNGASGREAVQVRWGLIPFWAKDPKIGYKMINARSETVTQKPAYRAAFRQRRCLVPANGYYEWQSRAGGKQPYLVFAKSGACFGIAGLWETWNHDGDTIESCTLMTCAANARLGAIHQRMPVVMRRADYGQWLGSDTGAEALRALLRPADEDVFDVQAVSTLVNSPRNDSIDCIAPHVD